MDRLWVLREIIPKGSAVIGMGEMSGRIAFLSVDEMWELCWIPQKEDGSVVGNDIPVPFLSSQLDGETSWISGQIMGARFATDGRKSCSDGTLLALLTEDVGRTQIVKWISADKFTVSTTAFGVDDSFWNTLTIEMGDEVYQVAENGLARIRICPDNVNCYSQVL